MSPAYPWHVLSCFPCPGGVRREDRYRIEDDRSRSPVQHQTSTSSADTPPLPRHPSVSNVPSNGWPLKDIFFGVVALIVIVAPLCCLSSVIGYIGGMCGMEKSNIAQNLCAGWLGWIGLGILVCLPVLCWVVLLAWFLRGKSTHQQISPGLASSNGHHGQTGNSSASPVSNGMYDSCSLAGLWIFNVALAIEKTCAECGWELNWFEWAGVGDAVNWPYTCLFWRLPTFVYERQYFFTCIRWDRVGSPHVLLYGIHQVANKHNYGHSPVATESNVCVCIGEG